MTADPPASAGFLEPPLDDRGGRDAGALPGRQRPESGGWRGLLRWSATDAPVALLLTAGIAAGPQGINLLPSAALSLLDAIVPVALAALGALVGLSVGDRRLGDARLLAAAGSASLVTVLVIAAGFGAAVTGALSPLAPASWILLLAGGICGATSLTLPSDEASGPQNAATRFVELGVLLPIAGGGILLAWLGADTALSAAGRLWHACAATLAVAAAAWLLLTTVRTEVEERIYAASALLLVGGVAVALSFSALFGGVIAGLVWRLAGRHPRETVQRDVLFLQHPLLVLVLLVAGARADLSPMTLGIGAVYVALRITGQLAAGVVGRRIIGSGAPRDLGREGLPPGVFGVGFALNVLGAAGADGSLLLSVVVVGTIGSAIVGAFLPPRSGNP